ERPSRRLLQRLQERIRGIAVHIIGRIDNNDAPGMVRCRSGKKMRDPADFLHRNARLELPGLLIEASIDMQYGGMHPCRNLSPERSRKIRSNEMLWSITVVAMRQHVPR